MWYNEQCRLIVTETQCRKFAKTVAAALGGVPDYVTDVVEWVCYCFTDGCVITWEW